jgi:hypothetical protein
LDRPNGSPTQSDQAESRRLWRVVDRAMKLATRVGCALGVVAGTLLVIGYWRKQATTKAFLVTGATIAVPFSGLAAVAAFGFGVICMVFGLEQRIPQENAVSAYVQPHPLKLAGAAFGASTLIIVVAYTLRGLAESVNA